MIVVAALAASAVVLALPPPPRRRLRRALGCPGRTRAGGFRDAQLWTSPTLAAVLAGGLVFWFVGGVIGIIAGVGGAVVIRRWVRSLETLGDRRRRERVERDLPHAVELVVAALAAGRPPGRALALVGASVGGPLAEDFAAVTAGLELGGDPTRVWREAARRPGLRPLARAFARAAQTGAPVTNVVGRCADDLRAERRSEAQRAARAVGVKTAAPLGACFLPAFMVVGIVPTLAGAFGRLVW